MARRIPAVSSIGHHVDGADKVCSLKDVAALEQLIPSPDLVRLGGAAEQRLLVVEPDQRADVAAHVGIGDLVEQNTARQRNHPSESVEGIQVAACASHCTRAGTSS